MTQASQAELMLMTVSEIVRCLIEAHEEGKDVNLNRQVFCTYGGWVILVCGFHWVVSCVSIIL